MSAHELGYLCQVIFLSLPFINHFSHLIARYVLGKPLCICLSFQLPLPKGAIG
jgi:hypothetical protein